MWVKRGNSCTVIMCSEPGKLVIGSHVSYLILGKSPHPIRNSTPFFDIRLSPTSTRYSWWVHFSKRFFLVRVTWDFFSLTDFPPASWGLGPLGLFACFTLSHTPFRTFCRFLRSITTVSQSSFGVRVLKKKNLSFLSFSFLLSFSFCQVSFFFWGFFFLSFLVREDPNLWRCLLLYAWWCVLLYASGRCRE
jgi:hypothetical protein